MLKDEMKYVYVENMKRILGKINFLNKIAYLSVS